MLGKDTMEVLRFEINGGEVPQISNWGTVLAELKLHAILPILGLRKKELMPPEPFINEVQSGIAQQISRFTVVAGEQQKIVNLLKEDGVYPVVIKGLAAAQYYPIPVLRTVGDIDFLLEEEKSFNRTISTVQEMGYSPMREYEGLSYQDSLNCGSRHFEFNKGNIEIEIHSRYVDKDSVIENYLEKAQIIQTNIEKWNFPTFPNLENGLILLRHVRFHLTYDGVGLRPILDWLFYVKCILTDEFWENGFSKIAEECNLKDLAVCLTRMGEVYFGLPHRRFTESADDDLCREFMELISKSGNFGRAMDPVSKKSKVLSNPFTALKLLQRKGLREWNFCNKHRVLTPFAWCYALSISIKEVKQQKNGFASVAKGISSKKQVDSLIYKLNM